ncbi:hypothetical protein NSP_11900 [Nodularia spumigena CCY9414]|nr:hypothetical protein NSP_11900 [Nodularia spumigena CCY9414]
MKVSEQNYYFYLKPLFGQDLSRNGTSLLMVLILWKSILGADKISARIGLGLEFQ